ncbi:MAG: PA14 domain-containing protein [Pirellulales bacterium]
MSAYRFISWFMPWLVVVFTLGTDSVRAQSTPAVNATERQTTDSSTADHQSANGQITDLHGSDPVAYEDDDDSDRGPAAELFDGLVAVYRSLADPTATVTRIDAKPAFWWADSSPHPRIPPGPWEAEWTGQLVLREADTIHFQARVSGAVRLEIDGQTVVEGNGTNLQSTVDSAQPFTRSDGVYPIRIHYRALPGTPARLQLWWRGETFGDEPLPAWQLKHRAADRPKSLADEEQFERARSRVVQLGCARCHAGAFPSVAQAEPGPSLNEARSRLKSDWLMAWLKRPSDLRAEASMPQLFADSRSGLAERAIVTEYLLQLKRHPGAEPSPTNAGDHRMGRRRFVELGCAACHTLPDGTETLENAAPTGRGPLVGLGDRYSAADLAVMVADPHGRYPDDRMPRIPMSAEDARNIAAFLLLWSPATAPDSPQLAEDRPTDDERAAVRQRLKVASDSDAALALIREKGCAQCHEGLGPAPTVDMAIAPGQTDRGCLASTSSVSPRFRLSASDRTDLMAYRAVARQEKFPSPVHDRQRLLLHLGCLRCHARDREGQPPLEVAGSRLGGAWLQTVPFQRTPRLHFVHQKFVTQHLIQAVRDSVQVRGSGRYTYRMPSFGGHAEPIVQALAEADGDLPDSVTESSLAKPVATSSPVDPTFGPLYGPQIAGFQGFSCVSCHVWNGNLLADPDPGAVGPDLTRVAGRIRRGWFDRFLENPTRCIPGTPMPSPFPRDKPSPLTTVLQGDVSQQREALWAYLSLGTQAPVPKPAPPLPVKAPSAGEPAIVAQIPLRVFDGTPLESIALLTADQDLVVYDLGTSSLRSVRVGAQILRSVQGRLRTYTASGTVVGGDWQVDPVLEVRLQGRPVEAVRAIEFHGYDRLPDGMRIRSKVMTAAGPVSLSETFRIERTDAGRRLIRRWELRDLPRESEVVVHARCPVPTTVDRSPGIAQRDVVSSDHLWSITVRPDAGSSAAVQLISELPAAETAGAEAWTTLVDRPLKDGALERPGYRATVYPSPKSPAGEDLVVPVAIAADPRDGRIFVASMKLGEIFVLSDLTGDGREARFEDYARGLFQDAYSMLAEPDALYVLHRRNLSKLVDTDDDGRADRVDRVFAVPHGVADSYDYGYGLVRDPSGAWIFTYAPYAHTELPGSGGALRLAPGASQPEPVAYGFRNPLGWCSGPAGEVLFTDNQGEWVATNKLCVLTPGRFYGFPNPKQPEHATKPRGEAAVWVPYAWAHSINGVTCDRTEGKFGPFAGQVFMAELMFGGAIVRANLEQVNGVYQGACFPFWSRGLLGPTSLAFDPAGRMWVASLTEPGWMAQPDRGAVYRLDYTGDVPFEIKSIHVQPDGFRMEFTRPVDPRSAEVVEAYRVEHYRYEYTGAYGSPELDRRTVPVERAEAAADGLSVTLRLPSLVRGRVYMITADGLQSPAGERLVHPTGAYTLHEVPAR